MKLAFRHYPAKEGKKFSSPIIILHGLFGSSKNWMGVADFLSQFSEVYALDLRNHGDSPHSSEHTLSAMAEDVREFLSDRDIPQIILLGHSMGGLVAMTIALENPEIVQHLIIQDISPRDYEFRYDSELSVLNTDVSGFQNRQEVDTAVSGFVPDPFIRNFLLMNLERREEGGYRWKLNVSGISGSRRMFESQFRGENKTYPREVLFILGGASEYFGEKDKEIALRYFPFAKFETIPGGDHYIHFTKAPEFKKILTDYLSSI
ncbi:alpha/beta fold hydrolase [Leptospira wolffii]|uniref:Alpha/beta fold hydrolase n=1 Tax=Leptospira wolffii TaxID=409998 RepID=A0ABV5BQ33_9LEPT|nr:alpha/beta fold hydrolase [Leptospira wolffii]EPG66728.1 PGAP1-like protein [Leptospira wolffii serovar Khorat str. Khorat-H2]